MKKQLIENYFKTATIDKSRQGEKEFISVLIFTFDLFTIKSILKETKKHFLDYKILEISKKQTFKNENTQPDNEVWNIIYYKKS